MSAAATDTKAEFACSCGRTFAHEISLKRHCWVTGHTAEEGALAAAEAEVIAPSPVLAPALELPSVSTNQAVEEALRILREKQQAQEAFELRKAREAQMRAALDTASAVVHAQVERATEAARHGALVAKQSAVLALRMALLVLVCFSLLLTGMGVGHLLNAPAGAATVSSQSAPLAAASVNL